MKTLRIFLTFLAALLVSTSLAVAAPLPVLTAPPLGERWFSVNVGGDRVGFAHLTIERENGGYRILSDGSVKMKVMGVSREAASKESYLVGPDLTLKSFSVEQLLDRSPMTVTGEVTPGKITVVEERGGKKKTRTLRLKGNVFPPQALNIYPLMHGADKGKKYRVPMFDAEAVKVKEIKVEVKGLEQSSPGTTVLHMENNLFPVVSNDIWVDLKGNTVKESVRDDLVVTLAEDEKSARAYLADEALAKKDLVLDFSLIKTAPITQPGNLKKLVLETTGIPDSMPLLQGARQSAERAGDKVIFSMPPATPAVLPSPRPEDLQPTARIPSDAPEMLAEQKAIVGETKDPAEIVRLLVRWVSTEIKGTVTDTQSPLETLKTRNGNCQTHARLYAALARSAGVPTRFVSGIVYSPGQGFLYHSWAESFVNHVWVPVDPTFGEIPANLTHVKLVEGDATDDMAALAGVIGKLQAKVVEQVY